MTQTFLARYRTLILIAIAALAALAVFVVVWFQPQKLAIDARVDETAPSAQPRASAEETMALSAPFRPLEHAAAGTAKVITSDGKTFVRFEDFEVENGPDLFVYLSAGDPAGSQRALADDFVDLGRLKGNIGDQNYEVPAGTDLEKYRTAVIWCRRFTVAFAAAELA